MGDEKARPRARSRAAPICLRRRPESQPAAAGSRGQADAQERRLLGRRHDSEALHVRGRRHLSLASWSRVPRRTREIELIVEDPDAEHFVHWTVLRIPSMQRRVGEGSTPRGAVETDNSFGKRGWGAPCPPRGDKPRPPPGIPVLSEAISLLTRRGAYEGRLPPRVPLRGAEAARRHDLRRSAADRPPGGQQPRALPAVQARRDGDGHHTGPFAAAAMGLPPA